MIRHPPRLTLSPNPTLPQSPRRDANAPDLRELRPHPYLAFGTINLISVPAPSFTTDTLTRPASGSPSTAAGSVPASSVRRDRKSTRLNSSHANISYAVFCLK